MSNSTLADLCIVACSEAFRGNGEVIATGVGPVPRLAAGLAKLTHSPGLMMTDGEAFLVEQPVPLGPRGDYKPGFAGHLPFSRFFDAAVWTGRRHAMVTPTQIDRFGQINLSQLGGTHRQPKTQMLGVRGFPGNTIYHPNSFFFPAHGPRVFVPGEVDMVSGVGYNPARRVAGGNYSGVDLRFIVTNLCVMDFAGPDHAVRVISLHPGVSFAEVQDATGFDLIDAVAGETAEPTAEQLSIIASLDPHGIRASAIKDNPPSKEGSMSKGYELVEPKPVDVVYETDAPVRYEVIDHVAWITLDRPQFNNAQNGQMTYALDDAFGRATRDDEVRVIVLGGAGKHFSAGHDIGTPGRDLHHEFDKRLMFAPHTNKPAAELLYTREQEQYLGMCRRWRECPKPTIAMVQGACVAGGLMLAWVCDLIVASEDAFFQDPVNPLMGIPGVEYFAHAYELPPRVAKEFLLLGERMSAQRAEQFGMVNKVVPRAELRDAAAAWAAKLASTPRLGNWLTKQAVNHVEELRGKRAAMDAVFHMHHFAHAHNDLMTGDSIAGVSGKSAASANKAAEG